MSDGPSKVGRIMHLRMNTPDHELRQLLPADEHLRSFACGGCDLIQLGPGRGLSLNRDIALLLHHDVHGWSYASIRLTNRVGKVTATVSYPVRIDYAQFTFWLTDEFAKAHWWSELADMLTTDEVLRDYPRVVAAGLNELARTESDGWVDTVMTLLALRDPTAAQLVLDLRDAEISR